MSKRVLTLNIIYAVFDALVGVCGIGVFGLAGGYFERWWITLFAVIPLALYNNRTMILDSILEEIAEENSKAAEREVEHGT